MTNYDLANVSIRLLAIGTTFPLPSVTIMRKPVGIASASFQTPHGMGTRVHVVCDDGTCWYLDSGTWHQLGGIPGTPGGDFVPNQHAREQV